MQTHDAIANRNVHNAIDDLDAESARLASVGIELTSQITTGLDGNLGAWIADPEGNRIELMEMAPNCIQFQAIKALKALRQK